MPAIEQRDLHGWACSITTNDTTDPLGGSEYEAVGVQIRQPLVPSELQFISSNPDESYAYMENYWRVEGLDENGKEIYEDFTPNGRTPVPGVKKFSYIRRIVPWDSSNLPEYMDAGSYIYGSDGGFETVTPTWSGACQGGSPRSVILGADASSENDYYTGMMVRFTSGTLSGQIARVASYDGATKTLTIFQRMGGPSTYQGIAGVDDSNFGGWGSGAYDDDLKYLGTPAAGDQCRVSPGWTMGDDTFSCYYESFYNLKSPWSGTKTVYSKVATEVWAGYPQVGDIHLVLDDPSGRIEWGLDRTQSYSAYVRNRLTPPAPPYYDNYPSSPYFSISPSYWSDYSRVGNTIQMRAWFGLDGGYNDLRKADVTPETTWSISDPNVATITSDGQVTFLTTGTVRVTGTYSGEYGTNKSTYADVRASNTTVTSITNKIPGMLTRVVGGTTADNVVPVGHTLLSDTRFNGSGSTTCLLESATSDNPSVLTASVDPYTYKAKVTGVAPGTANLTVTYGGFSTTTAITVVAADPASMTLALYNANDKRDCLQYVRTTLTFANNTYKWGYYSSTWCTYSSSDLSVATVSQPVRDNDASIAVTNVGAGDATITATYALEPGITASVPVTIIDDPNYSNQVIWTRDPLTIRYDDNFNGVWLRMTLNAKEKLNLHYRILVEGQKA